MPPTGPDPARSGEITLYVGELLHNLIQIALVRRGFRGVLPGFRDLIPGRGEFGSDEASNPTLGITAIATAARASITANGTQPFQLGLISFGAIHRHLAGEEPGWVFEDDSSDLHARCHMRGRTFDVACTANPDGSATITLSLVP